MTATPDGGRTTAPLRAEAGERAWAEAARLQLWAEPAHADFYALAAAIVPTLDALQDLAGVRGDQVAGYGRDRAVHDDTRSYDPELRLAEAADDLRQLGHALGVARRQANRFWSGISHIGVEAQ